MIESAPPLQRLVSTKLAWASERFGVLAQNLANADTPDYRARDIKSPDFERMLMSDTVGQTPQLQVTQAGHVLPVAQQGNLFRSRGTDSFEISPTGNGVVIEEQMQKLGETQMDYGMATGIYTKFKGFLRSAMGDTRA